MGEIEKMARLLCQGDGLDPDMLGFDAVVPETRRGIKFITPEFRRMFEMPMWHFYANLAEAALTFEEAA